MKLLLPFLFAGLCLAFAPSSPGAPAADMHFSAEGLEIKGGSMGNFTIAYPELLDGSQKELQKLAEKKPSGRTATLRYSGGLQVDLAAEGGKLLIKFPNVPAEMKYMSFGMFIPIAFNQGGKWKIGDKEGEFPQTKPAQPHLYQGNAPALELTNYEGRVLHYQAPPYSFLQLTDNREWNWSIFHLKTLTPLANDRKEVALSIDFKDAVAPAKPLIDRFGQNAREQWSGKIASEDELKQDVESEKAYYASLQPPKLGTYGGLPGSKEKLGLQATGFFHVEKKGERWILVDPEGHAFFHLGLCTVNPGEDYTLVKGRERAFEWIPPRDGVYASVYRPTSEGVVSFHLANLIRKYGQPYDVESYTARMIERMRKWGFNSIGAFSGPGRGALQAAKFPTVAHLPLSEWEGVHRIPGIEQVIDPFDEKTRAKVEENLAKHLPGRASDPLLIGYFIVNEPIYENIQHIVPSLKGSAHACKRRLVQALEQKYKTAAEFNRAWNLQIASFAELQDRVIPVETPAAKADVHAFAGLFLDEYFRFISTTFRKHDRNHLLIGSRLMPGTIKDEQLCRIMGKYLDVVSFNYYTDAVDTALLRRIYEWSGRKPMILSEFYWGAPKESGLSGGREVTTQVERGLAYRNYVEQSAALGFVVGIEWFTLIDQSASGRWFQGFNGERANTGVLSVTDRPWKETLAEMMKTNYDIYKVWFGEKAPFAYENPRFKAPAAK